MEHTEIDVKALQDAINAVLNHVIKDLGLTKIRIESPGDHYWHCPASELNDMSKVPMGLDIGSLSDDVDFVKLIKPGQSGDISYNLIHVAPLLRYIAEKIRK
jgi:hypothetical protein